MNSQLINDKFIKKTNFDHLYYKNKYYEYRLKTNDDAINHWDKIGYKKRLYVSICDEMKTHDNCLCRCKIKNNFIQKNHDKCIHKYKIKNDKSIIDEINNSEVIEKQDSVSSPNSFHCETREMTCNKSSNNKIEKHTEQPIQHITENKTITPDHLNKPPKLKKSQSIAYYKYNITSYKRTRK